MRMTIFFVVSCLHVTSGPIYCHFHLAHYTNLLFILLFIHFLNKQMCTRLIPLSCSLNFPKSDVFVPNQNVIKGKLEPQFRDFDIMSCSNFASAISAAAFSLNFAFAITVLRFAYLRFAVLRFPNFIISVICDSCFSSLMRC